MGAKGSKAQQVASRGVVIALPDGKVQVYLTTVTAGEVMDDFPDHVVRAVCGVEEVDAQASALPPTELLQLQQLYFLCPKEADSCESEMWDEQQGQLLGRITYTELDDAQANFPEDLESFKESPRPPISSLSIQLALQNWLTFKQEASEIEPAIAPDHCVGQSAHHGGGLLTLRERLQALCDDDQRSHRRNDDGDLPGRSRHPMEDEMLVQSPVELESPLFSPRGLGVAYGEWRPSFPLAHERSVSPRFCPSPERSPLSWDGQSDGPSEGVSSNGHSPVFFGEHFGKYLSEPLGEPPCESSGEPLPFDGRFERSPILYGSWASASGAAAQSVTECSGTEGGTEVRMEVCPGGSCGTEGEVEEGQGSEQKSVVADEKREHTHGYDSTGEDGSAATAVVSRRRDFREGFRAKDSLKDSSGLDVCENDQGGSQRSRRRPARRSRDPKVAPAEDGEEDNWLANSAAYAQAAGRPTPIPRRKDSPQRGRANADSAAALRAAGRRWRPSLDAVAESGGNAPLVEGSEESDGGGVGVYPLSGRAASRFKGKRWSLEYLEEKKKERVALETNRPAECVF